MLLQFPFNRRSDRYSRSETLTLPVSLVGFIIYFGYGIRNSVEGIPKQDTNDNDFILQGTPDIEQDLHNVQPGHASGEKEPLAASFNEPSEEQWYVSWKIILLI